MEEIDKISADTLAEGDYILFTNEDMMPVGIREIIRIEEDDDLGVIVVESDGDYTMTFFPFAMVTIYGYSDEEED